MGKIKIPSVSSIEDYFQQVYDRDIRKDILGADEKEKFRQEYKLSRKADSEKIIDIPPVDQTAKSSPAKTDVSIDNLTLSTDTTGRISPEELQKIWAEVLQIKTLVQDIDFQQKLKKVLDEVDSYIQDKIKELDKKLEDFMNRNVPKRKQYDSSGVYKEHVFKVVEYVLDDVLTQLVDQVPRYTFISSQVSKLFEDGTICNALVSVVVSIVYEGYKYDFKADVPIVNGVALAPLYLQRGLKLIPLTKQDIHSELESMSFSKVEPEYVTKPNLFSNTQTMHHRQQDTQKMYPVDTNKNLQEVSLPELSQWLTQRIKQRWTDEG